jgi:hypothetical protein
MSTTITSQMNELQLIPKYLGQRPSEDHLTSVDITSNDHGWASIFIRIRSRARARVYIGQVFE